MRSNNNFPIATPMPSALHAFPLDETEDVFVLLQVFTDRSAVVALEQDDLSITDGGHGKTALAVLPVALRMTNTVTLAEGRYSALLSLSSPRGEHTDLMLAHHGRGLSKVTAPKPLFAPRPAEDEQTSSDTIRLSVAHALVTEARAWAEEIARLPWIADPGTARAEGILGQDLPCPEGARPGAPYAWPASCAYTNVEAGEMAQVEAFLRLACIHAATRLADPPSDAYFGYTAGARNQAGRTTGVTAQVRVAHDGTQAQRAALKSLLDRALDHPKAPVPLRRLCATNVVYANKKKTRTELAAKPLAFWRLSRDTPTAHERLAAHRLFEAPPATEAGS